MIKSALAACACVAMLTTACTSTSSSSTPNASSPSASSPSASSPSASSPSASSAGAPTSRAPSSSAPSSSTSATSTQPAPSTSATSKPSSSAPPKGPSACTNQQLSVGHGVEGGASSHADIVIVFLNESTHICTVTGYPGAAVLDAGGKQIVQATRTRSGFLGGCGCAPHTVTLRPGGKASAIVEGDNGGGDACLRGRALLVTPPNTTQSTRIPFQAYSCHVQVHPMVAGAGGGKAK